MEAIVEGQLGSFNGELPKLALAQYKGDTDNWAEYSAMVTDLRTICPLEKLVGTMKNTYNFPIVSFYTATETRSGDGGLETGNVADAGMDLGAILGLLEESSSRLVLKYIQKVILLICFLFSDLKTTSSESSFPS